MCEQSLNPYLIRKKHILRPYSDNSKKHFQYMESSAFFFTFFLWFLLLSVTGYSVYVSFGPPSKKLRDPFEEHED